jgi:nucleotide-binding universal stress UspA family protein
MGTPSLGDDTVAMRILCGLDSSSPALNAARFASSLAERAGGEVTFVHAVESPWASRHDSFERTADRRHAAARCFEQLVDELAGAGGVTPTLRIVVGDPARRLRELARQEDVDVIVIGATRHGRWSRSLCGSVQVQLTTDVDRPLLVVPAGRALRSGEDVLLARDVGSRSTSAAGMAGRLAAALGGSVRIVYGGTGDAAVTGWAAYDVLRCAATAVSETGDDVAVSVQRGGRSLLRALAEETARSRTGLVMVEPPHGNRWFGQSARTSEAALERLGCPWMVAPGRLDRVRLAA